MNNTITATMNNIELELDDATTVGEAQAQIHEMINEFAMTVVSTEKQAHPDKCVAIIHAKSISGRNFTFTITAR